ncbi:N-acetylglucosamine kinase [Pseudalkalibacillus caeni]|uniref:ATPase BadF/BadG/BcrA/BcrD type domain-containing protein n=1 Tax=Exobacillus caeni TaxID=2574798 RepID=A0A5R9F457_9BACL|nr:BadF/BadG/BcrA/BcrD ATPase family protein [Pseudalkalibacillus caeni]TLS38472.1 hypothetical protein FCL54_04855 [Pseudalkalibacillus caeni]
MQLNNGLYIGLDGGGTKTTCVLGDGTGKILAYAVGKSSNMKSKSWEEVKLVLHELIERVLHASHKKYEEVYCLYFSLAGGDRPEDKSRIIASFKDKVRKNAQVVVQNDAFSALAAGTWGEAGSVLISGTGSIAYCLAPSTGKKLRVGGWGYVMGDEGSGFDIGRKALTAVLRAYDGRGPETVLTEKILTALALKDAPQLVTAIYESNEMRKVVAGLSKIVLKAVEDKDTIAIQILEEAVEDLVEMAEVLASKTTDDKSLPIVLSGGMFSSEFFRETFLKRLRKKLRKIEATIPEVPPVVGAYVLAMNQDGITIEKEQKEQIINTWKEHELLDRKVRDQGGQL